MSLRHKISQSRLLAALSQPPWRQILERMPIVGRQMRGWRRTHPIDDALGIETSGFLPASMLADEASRDKLIKPYAGCQPSALRAALAVLPDVSDYTFVDLGCGKGRALAVASEFPFKTVVGIELSERLAAIASENARILAARDPQRTAISVVVGDAIEHDIDLPLGPRVVYFLYNPFDERQLETFLRHVTGPVRRSVEHLFVLYYNPVVGHVVDRSDQLVRFSAENYAVDAAERDFGPVTSDTVVMWQSLPPAFPPRTGADRKIVAPAGSGHAHVA